MSACCYIVPSQQPTVVSFAKTGVLTANDALNLVLAKGNRLQLLLVLPDGLKPLQEITVPGKVAALCTLRRKGDVSFEFGREDRKVHLVTRSSLRIEFG